MFGRGFDSRQLHSVESKDHVISQLVIIFNFILKNHKIIFEIIKDVLLLPSQKAGDFAGFWV